MLYPICPRGSPISEENAHGKIHKPLKHPYTRKNQNEDSLVYFGKPEGPVYSDSWRLGRIGQIRRMPERAINHGLCTLYTACRPAQNGPWAFCKKAEPSAQAPSVHDSADDMREVQSRAIQKHCRRQVCRNIDLHREVGYCFCAVRSMGGSSGTVSERHGRPVRSPHHNLPARSLHLSGHFRRSRLPFSWVFGCSPHLRQNKQFFFIVQNAHPGVIY